MTPITKLWRVSKLAEKHGIPKQTLHDYVQSGRLRSVRTACGLPLIAEADLIKFLSNGRPVIGRPRKE